MRRSHGSPGGAQQRAGDPELEQALAGDDPDPLRALEEDLVAVEQRLVLVDPRRHLVAEGAQLLLEADRDVLEDAADLEVAGVHPLPGRHLEQVEDRVALAQRVPEHRDRAEVERGRAEPEQVRVDPVELEVDRAQVLRPRRDLELEQRLDRAAERLHVEEVGEVVHPLDERDHLPVALVLAALLDPGVDVADDRLQVEHLLALEADQQAQHPVGGGVVRAHVHGQQLVLGLERLAGLGALDRRGADHLGGGRGDHVAARAGALGGRVARRSGVTATTREPGARCG